MDSAGQQSLHLQGAVDGLVSEISALVELSGRIIVGLNQLDVNRVVTDLKMTLIQRLDGLNQSQGGMCICRVLGIGAGVSRECFGP